MRRALAHFQAKTLPYSFYDISGSKATPIGPGARTRKVLYIKELKPRMKNPCNNERELSTRISHQSDPNTTKILNVSLTFLVLFSPLNCFLNWIPVAISESSGWQAPLQYHLRGTFVNWYDDHPPIPRLFHSEITLPVLKIKTTHLPVSMMVINSMFGGGGGGGHV